MPPGFRLFAACLLLLVLKTFLVAFLAPIARRRARARINPEDVSPGERVVEVEPESVARVLRAHRNDVDNLLVFAIVGSIALATRVAPLVLAACSVTFVVARLAHTAAYLGHLRRPRIAAYTLGVTCTCVLAGYCATALAR